MKLSLIFELLMIFVLLAFAASKSVRKEKNNKKQIQNKNDEYIQDENSASKYCKCSEAYCNCCRDFALPVVNLDGPGCASLMYLENGKMSVSLSFGRKVITNKTLSSKKPSPICMPLPGGISKFCGRVYNIARTGEEFRACLGLELQNKQSVEAAVRVSCFKFGPRGVNTEPADPLPLVPQDEVEDDDDDDDDDDDYGLGDDDDDDGLGEINDVDTADYTGFSILGEDLLGDLFGSSDTKKPKDKNKNKKKQAPVQLPSSTTSTRRPRPSRRPTRRPTRVTTPRTTTVKVRPGNRRPTRRPNGRPSTGRPNRNPTTPFTENSTPSMPTANQVITIPVMSSVSPAAVSPVSPAVLTLQTTERVKYQSTANYDTYEPVVIVTQKPSSTIPVSTSKPVTNFEDPGIEMSLAHITGQLSSMPASSIISNDAKESGLPASVEESNFEKVETITPKGTTASYSKISQEKVNEDMVQIVHNLDSSSEEDSSKKETMATDESRSHDFVFPQPKKKEGDEFDIEDMDVLDLSAIGETVGHELGLFGKKKRQNRHNKDKDTKLPGEDNDSADYDVLGLEEIGETVGEQLGMFERKKRQNANKEPQHEKDKDSNEYDALGLETLGESLGLERSNKNTGKRDRRRQNKMMRGEWSQV